MGRAVARVAPCGLLELPGLGSLASMPSSTCDTRWLSIAKALDSFCRKSVVAALGARCARAHSPLRPADDLQHMRVMERRFIIWTSRDAHEEERQQQQEQPQRRKKPRKQQPPPPQQPLQQQQGDGGGGSGSGEDGDAAGSSGQQGGAWDRDLAGIWREFTHRLEVR